MPECVGTCCVAFFLPYKKDEFENRATKKDASDEIRKVNDMIIPVTNSTVRRRRNKFGMALGIRKENEGHYFKCKHWDEETKLCNDYENRPVMCRDYPYDKVCSMGCNGCAPSDIVEKYEQQAEKSQEAVG